MKKIIVVMVLGLSIISCKKKPGEGGFASIEGRLYVKNFDNFFTYVVTEHYLPGENIYIVYGDGNEVGNSVKTSYDGSFKFNYLRKGKYKIYAIGKDTVLATRDNPKIILKEINITKKKEKIVLDDFIIFN